MTKLGPPCSITVPTELADTVEAPSLDVADDRALGALIARQEATRIALEARRTRARESLEAQLHACGAFP